MSLTYSHNRDERPMHKGNSACEGDSFSLTSPSHFLPLTCSFRICVKLGNKTMLFGMNICKPQFFFVTLHSENGTHGMLTKNTMKDQPTHC